MKNNLAGLESLIKVHKLDIILLQEVRITDEQIDILIGKFCYQGKVNINLEESSRPGSAIVWRSSLPVRVVSTIVPCRAQCAFLGAYAFLNVYAPIGKGIYCIFYRLSQKRGVPFLYLIIFNET